MNTWKLPKAYSTPKSGGFINGTLDGIVNQLKKGKQADQKLIYLSSYY